MVMNASPVVASMGALGASQRFIAERAKV